MIKINKSAETRFNDQAQKLLKQKALPTAERLVPVDDGDLKNSLQVGTSSDGSPYLFVDKSYGPNVEFGTVDMEPQPFLRPAIRQMDTR